MRTPELPEEMRGALVAAVDDSAPAREALRYAAGMAAAMRRPLTVLAGIDSARERLWQSSPSPIGACHVNPSLACCAGRCRTRSVLA